MPIIERRARNVRSGTTSAPIPVFGMFTVAAPRTDPVVGATAPKTAPSPPTPLLSKKPGGTPPPPVTVPESEPPLVPPISPVAEDPPPTVPPRLPLVEVATDESVPETSDTAYTGVAMRITPNRTTSTVVNTARSLGNTKIVVIHDEITDNRSILSLPTGPEDTVKSLWSNDDRITAYL